MTFILLILLTAFLMEGVGSYISVVGLSALFSGDLVIIAMAVIMDVAKVTTVSFIYQYWREIRKTMRAYMTAAVIVLMTITSAGAFGYLSAAFQRAVQPNREIALKVDALTREMTALEAEKKELTDTKLKINQQIANVPTSTEDTARRRLISSFKPELDRAGKRLEVVNKRVDSLRSEVLQAQSENVAKDVHTGPITYVSKAFGLSLEDSSKYIILLIVSVFDPLAIMLVIAGNFLIERRRLVVIEPVKAPKIEASEPKPTRHQYPIVDDKLITSIREKLHKLRTKNVVRAKRLEEDVEPRARVAKVVQKAEPQEIKPIEVTVEQLDLPEQAPLIEETRPARSILSDLKIGIEDALFKHGVVTISKKRSLYAS